MSMYVEPIVLRDAKVFSKNFSGIERIFNGRTVNTKGSRNFCLEIPEDLAMNMKDNGWNIKHTNPQDPDEPVRYYVQVSVQYRDRNGDPVRPVFRPVIKRIDSCGDVVLLNEDTVEELDDDEILSVNVKIRGREYEPGRIKAYAKIVYAKVDEADPFAKDYRGNSPLAEDDDDLPFDID